MTRISFISFTIFLLYFSQIFFDSSKYHLTKSLFILPSNSSNTALPNLLEVSKRLANFSKVTRQSDRLHIYNDVFNELKKKNLIYPCFETQEELSLKRKIQLKQGKPPIYDRSSLRLNKKDISRLISNGKSPHWRLKLDDKPIVKIVIKDGKKEYIY